MSDKIRRVQSCRNISDNAIFHFKEDGLKFYTCVGNFTDPAFYHLWDWCKIYNDGKNPFGEKYCDTPNKLKELSDLINFFELSRLEKKNSKNGK